MLIIRLQRVGRKGVPSFRIVVVDRRRATKSGAFVEIVGSHNPVHKRTNLKKDRISYWMSCGAKTSLTVKSLLTKHMDGSIIQLK